MRNNFPKTLFQDCRFGRTPFDLLMKAASGDVAPAFIPLAVGLLSIFVAHDRWSTQKHARI